MFGTVSCYKKAPSVTSGLVATLVAVIWAWSPVAYSATPIEYGRLELHYQAGMPRVMPAFDKAYGRYLGSGKGEMTGKIKGTLVWDLYEEQSNPKLHRTQFVGWMTAPDDSKIAFETTGYFIPRQGGKPFWDLTSAMHFSDATGEAYGKLAGRIGLWQGSVHIVDADTFIHTYRLFLPEPTE